MRLDTLSPNVTLAEPLTRHLTDRLLYEPTRTYSLATYSATRRDTTSIDRRDIEADAKADADAKLEQYSVSVDQVFTGGAE